jgi:hypothetical protein
MPDVACKILVPAFLKLRVEGARFMQLLFSHFPSYVPNRFGRDEPLRKKFLPGGLDLLLEEWGHLGFGAMRTVPPTMEMHVWFAMESIPKPHHTSITVRLDAVEQCALSSIQSFLTDCAIEFGAHLAVAHILTEVELLEKIERLRTLPGTNPAYMVRRMEKLGVAETLHGMTVLQFLTKNLRLNIPDLCWLTIFGPPYIQLFGRDKLLSTPAAEVRELGDQSVLVKVTADIPDTPEGWRVFKASRERCKTHLNSDAFYDSAASLDKIYRVPEFRFPLEMYRPVGTV